MQGGVCKCAWSLRISLVLPKPSKLVRTNSKSEAAGLACKTYGRILRLVLANLNSFAKVVLWPQPGA